MTFEETICRALGESAPCVSVGNAVAVPTHCLYPTNKAVSVLISGGPRECVVSDNGGALDELTACGLTEFVTESFKLHVSSVCKGRGVRYSNGHIVSPPVPLEGLPTALAMVANTSSEVAHWGLRSLKPRRKRSLRSEISRILGHYFSAEQILAQEHITGHSTRRYPIDWVIRMSSSAKVLIDMVLPEPSSINAKAIAHMDIRGISHLPNSASEGHFETFLAYDDEDEWKSSDLSLLKMAGRLVPLKTFDRSISKLARTHAGL